MDDIIYSALGRYYHALELKGYMSHSQSAKLLILIFLRDFVYHDYRGIITRDDYHIIERALDCLYGSTCLIPYPDYLKMGKLYLGAMSEMAERVKTLENTDVVKVMTDVADVDMDKELSSDDGSDK